MALVKSNRDVTIISKHGVDALIKAYTVTEIPDVLLPEALVQWCFRCDEYGNLLGVEGLVPESPKPESIVVRKEEYADAPVYSKEERKLRIREAVAFIIVENIEKELDKKGMPAVRSVAKRVGFKVTPLDVFHAVKFYQQRKAA